MALGELAAIGAVQQRQVRVARVLVAEGVEDEELLGRVGEMVVAADHVGDPHLGVVDGDREVVEDAAVAAGDDEVVVAAVGEGDRAADQVLDHGLAVVGHPQADRRALVIDGLSAVAPVGAVLGLPGLDLLGGRRVAVRGAGLEQPGQRGLVLLGPRDLGERALVPVELQPAQRVEDLLDVLLGRALAVGVLDAQDEAAASVAGGEPVVERRPRPTDMQGAGRRGGEPESGVVAHRPSL